MKTIFSVLFIFLKGYKMSKSKDEVIVQVTKPEMWPTVDEFPETDVSDLVRKFEESVVPED